MRTNGFSVGIRKTDIVDVNDKSHPLPPDNGLFQEFRVSEYYCPDEWSKDGIFIPAKEGEPLWFDFRGNDECACVCSVQRLNPVTGEPVDLKKGLTKDPKQNYLVLPSQRWLDGYAQDGKVYQFVVTKAGIGLAVSEFVLPKHMQDSHALGFAFYDPKKPKPKPQLPSPIPVHHYWHHHWSTPDVKKLAPDFLGETSWFSSAGLGGSSDVPLGAAGGILRSGATGQSMNGMQSSQHLNTVGRKSIVATCSVAPPVEAEQLTCASIEAFHVDSMPTIDIVEEQKSNPSQCDKASMGAGGRILQKIVQDENTVKYYRKKPSAILTVYLALPEMFDAIMGKGPRQDPHKKDKFIASGKIGGIQVPLLVNGK